MSGVSSEFLRQRLAAAFEAAQPTDGSSIEDALTQRGRGAIAGDSRVGRAASVLEALNEAARKTQGLWLALVSLTVYHALSMATVTHEQLFLETPFRLPIINVELPLVPYFWAAPVLLFFVHLYFLINLFLLAENAGHLNKTLADPDLRAGAATARLFLSNFLFVQLLAGERRRGGGLIGALMRVIGLSTVVLLPPAALIETQIIFLPYQDLTTTFAHRGLVVADLALVLFFWPLLHRAAARDAGDEAGDDKASDALAAAGGRINRLRRGLRRAADVAGAGLIGAATLAVAVFSVWFASPLGETRGDEWFAWARQRAAQPDAQDFGERKDFEQAKDAWRDQWSCAARPVACAYAFMFTKGVNESYSTSSPFVVRLDVHDVEAGASDEQFARADDRPVRDFSGRSLRYADLSSANLRRTNFRRADLHGAILNNADLRKSNLRGADLESASLGRAKLQEANLNSVREEDKVLRTNLQGADLLLAQLQGAYLSGAKLQGAYLLGAQLQGADLSEAQLQGAGLSRAQLQGADLGGAQLQGAYLLGAQLQGADLSGAKLQGANLSHAQLQGAILSSAQLQGADLWRAELQGADLWLAEIARVGGPLGAADHALATSDTISCEPISKVRATQLLAVLEGVDSGAAEDGRNRIKAAGRGTEADAIEAGCVTRERLAEKGAVIVDDAESFSAYLAGDQYRRRLEALRLQACTAGEPAERAGVVKNALTADWQVRVSDAVKGNDREPSEPLKAFARQILDPAICPKAADLSDGLKKELQERIAPPESPAAP